jgi:RHS repeat-associated protein
VAVGTAAQATTSVAFDKDGNQTSTTDQLGHLMTSAYDALNRVTAGTDQLGHTVSTAYDPAGNATTTTDALGDVSTRAYDALNRNTLTTDSNGHTATTIFDADGAAVGSIDGAGDVTRSADNALGEQVGSVDGDGKVTQDGYDAAGQKTFLTDPDGNQTQWVYDTLGRQFKEIDPFGHAVTTLYDTAGRVTSVTDQLGRAITYAYDAVNRLIGETWKSAAGATTNVQTITYDNNGNQLTAADYSGTYTMGYDAQDRMTAQTGPFGVALTYAYDAANRATTLQDSQGGVLTSVYDNASRLQTREFGGAGQTPLRIDLGYDNADRLTGLTRSNNLAGTSLVGTTSYSYDVASRLTGIVSQNASLATVSYYNYQYDNADRVTVQSGTGATGTYGYDAASQVTGDGTKTYSYDSNGNRNMSGYQTGTNNQTTNDGTWTYTYAAAGNLTGKSNSSATWSYGYDNKNHLKTVQETVSGSTALAVTYTYDVFGQRIEEDKWASGTGTVSTRFVWSGTQVMLDMNGSNVVQERYLWGDAQDQLFARIDGNGTAWWYLTDREGSVRDVLNASGTQADHTDYTAFGVIITQTSAAAQGRFAFTSKDDDSQTGFQFNVDRYYAPALGIFISTDPIQFEGGLTTLYGYCGNDPTNATDPSGRFIVFNDEASAKRFITDVGAKHGEIVKGESGDYYVILGPEDSDAVFKYADKKFGDVFDPKFEGSKKTSLTPLAKRRNLFLMAAGVAGNRGKGFGQFWSDPDGNEIAANRKDIIRTIPDKLKGIKDDNNIHIDIGGEGGHADAINVNIGTIRDNKSIQRLIIRLERDARLPFPDRSVDQVTMESTEISRATAEEIARIIKPGGKIFLSNPSDAFNKGMHQLVINAISERGGRVEQRETIEDKVKVLNTTITMYGFDPFSPENRAKPPN